MDAARSADAVGGRGDGGGGDGGGLNTMGGRCGCGDGGGESGSGGDGGGDAGCCGGGNGEEDGGGNDGGGGWEITSDASVKVAFNIRMMAAAARARDARHVHEQRVRSVALLLSSSSFCVSRDSLDSLESVE